MLALTFARIFSFSMFPIRIVTYLGGILCLGSMLAALALVIYKITGNVVAGWTSMMVLMLFLFGLNFAFLGVLGEYIGRIFLETKQRPKFMIGEIVWVLNWNMHFNSCIAWSVRDSLCLYGLTCLSAFSGAIPSIDGSLGPVRGCM